MLMTTNPRTTDNATEPKRCINAAIPPAHATLFQLGLIDPASGEVQIEYRCQDADQAAAWADSWLDEPLDQIVFIIPPVGFDREGGAR